MNSWFVGSDLALVFFGATLLPAIINASDGIAGHINSFAARLLSRGSHRRPCCHNLPLRRACRRQCHLSWFQCADVWNHRLSREVNTTTINVVWGLLTPKSGEALIKGRGRPYTPPLHTDSRRGRFRNPQREQIGDDLTVRHKVQAMADNLALPRSERKGEAHRPLEFALGIAIRRLPLSYVRTSMSFARPASSMASMVTGTC